MAPGLNGLSGSRPRPDRTSKNAPPPEGEGAFLRWCRPRVQPNPEHDVRAGQRGSASDQVAEAPSLGSAYFAIWLMRVSSGTMIQKNSPAAIALDLPRIPPMKQSAPAISRTRKMTLGIDSPPSLR